MTCLAFATTAAHEIARSLASTVVEDLAEEVLYWGCKQVDQNVIPGTTFRSASTALTQWGQPVEALWTYDPLRDDTAASYNPPAAAIDPAVCNRTNLVRITADDPTINAVLTNGRPVILGIQMSIAFLYPANGHIALPQPTDILADGHAVLVVGYDDGITGHGEWIIRNSWGTGWGMAGYGFLQYRYVERYGGEAWIIA
jgi:C1A family cysteine protease